MAGLTETPTTATEPPRGLAAEVRPMLALALPLVISELGWNAMGVIDTIMVGRLGPGAIAAVGLGNITFFSVCVFGIGILMGLDTLVSQSFGAGDLKDCHKSLIQGVYLALGASLPLMGVVALAGRFLGSMGLDPEVAALARPYLMIQGASLPALLVFFALRRYLQGMNLTAPILVALGVANAANLFGNWLFVYGNWGMPRLGVAGSGLSTLASRVAMLAALAIYAVIHAARTRSGLIGTALRPDRARLRALLRLGLPTAGQFTVEVLVFGVAAYLAGWLGKVPLAAHEIVLQIASTTFMVPWGVSSAGAVRVGQAIGRGDPRGASRSGWAAMALGVGFMTIASGVMLGAPGPILGVFTTDAGVVATARRLIVAAAIFQVFDGLQVIASGDLRGLGETRIPMLATLVAHWAIGLPIGYMLAFPFGWGVIGLWVGLALGLGAAGLMLLAAWALRARRL